MKHKKNQDRESNIEKREIKIFKINNLPLLDLLFVDMIQEGFQPPGRADHLVTPFCQI